MYRCLRLGKLIRRFIEVGILIGFFVIGSRISLAAAEKSREAPIMLPVIMYHSVCEKPPADYVVAPSQLDSDLSWLSTHGFSAVSAQQLIDYTRGRGELPKRPVLITFDDGFYNNLSVALPILEKYDMCAVVSIVGRYTDDYAAADPHADTYSYLTWGDISELASSGRVEIGSHTYDMHSRSGLRQGCARLPEESVEDYTSLLRADIGLLKTELHENCGIVPSVFAYPFGALSRESLPVLRDSGILMSLTCREGMNTITREPDCLYGIFRYNRSGLLTTDEYMERITKELPE
ncbi:polysaccharide deacetylase family protein [Ruminococcus sp.]|uniref:polysaccharide deacetylase family protein n=1 Tax=Ruminococcus sp. TaxID=41978 RepID=UPI0025CD786B|nr:polysaccharide deacetylase family protein [Ruminococcus sp.]MCR4639123.1 polysaccharide deacetylase family protein [Ruminococcus sp.]